MRYWFEKIAYANAMQYKALSRTPRRKWFTKYSSPCDNKTRSSVGRRKYLRRCATPEAILMHPSALTYALTQVFEVYRWCVSLHRHTDASPGIATQSDVTGGRIDLNQPEYSNRTKWKKGNFNLKIWIIKSNITQSCNWETPSESLNS